MGPDALPLVLDDQVTIRRIGGKSARQFAGREHCFRLAVEKNIHPGARAHGVHHVHQVSIREHAETMEVHFG